MVEGIPVEFILEESTCVAMPSYEFTNCYEAFITSSDLSSELYEACLCFISLSFLLGSDLKHISSNMSEYTFRERG